MKKLLLFTLIFCLLISSFALAKKLPNEIVPGKSVGGINIGISVKDLKASIGDPDKVTKSNTGVAGQQDYIYNYNLDKNRPYGLLFTIENNKVISIYVFEDDFVSPGNIKVGSSSQKVMKQYKDQIDKKYYLMAQNDLGGINIIFPYKGIGFMLKEDKSKNDELVTNILIIKPDPTWKP